MVSYLDKFNLISDRQYGFREGRGTSEAIAHLTSIIGHSLNSSLKAIAIFLDLKKAFDTVSHEILLKKAENMGIRGKVRELLASYLSQRQQCVRVGGIVSGRVDVVNGVPQGTILGPVLFLIYINDLLSIETNATILSYADDTVLIVEGVAWDVALRKSEALVNKVSKWLCNNLLTLNCDKTKYLAFGIYDSSIPDLPPLKIHCLNCAIYHSNMCDCQMKIDRIKAIKYLGVHVDSNLRWECQAHELTKRLRKIIYAFKQIKRYLNDWSLRTAYFSFFQALLQYGIVGWGALADVHLRPVFIVQKAVLKVILGKPTLFSTNSLFEEARVFSPRMLYFNAVLITAYKIKQLTNISHIYSTRYSAREPCMVPRPNKSAFQRTYCYIAPKLWTLLPVEFRNINNINLFKKRVKCWLSDHGAAIIESFPFL